MVILQNIPENLRYFLFKKNLSAREFASQINESHSTLLAILKGKIAKTNPKLCQKIAKAMGIDLNLLQVRLLENNPVTFKAPLPIIKHKDLDRPIIDCAPIGLYETSSKSVDKRCFVIKTDEKLNYFPAIPSKCYVVLKPVVSVKMLRDGDTLLLLHKDRPILRIIEVHQSDKNTFISTLTSRLQVADVTMRNEFEAKYKILGKVVEVRHG